MPAPRSAPPSDAPTTELGAQLQVSAFAKPLIPDREIARDLRWPRSVQHTYPRMFNDAHVDGLYRGAMFPIRAYRWWLDPNGAPQSAVERVSADYNLPVGPSGAMNRRRGQQRFNFDAHLEDALRAPGYGHYPFEQVFQVERDGPADVNGGWVAHLRKLAPRPPATIIEITAARDGGLDSIKVPALNADRSPLDLMQGATLSVDRLVMYVWDREGANWRGRSMLRSCYGPFLLKDRILKVGAYNIERAGGVPWIEAPEGADKQMTTDLLAIATTFRVGEEAGAVLPHGAQLKFAQAAGGDQAISYVRLMNEEMARAWLMMWMTQGQTSSGHGSTEQTGEQIDYFERVQHTIAEWFAGTFNEHVIEDDVDFNEGPGTEYAPLLRFTPHGDPLDALAGEIDNAQVAGALPANSEVAAMVKGERGRRRPTRAADAATPPQQETPEPRTPAEQHVDWQALQAAFLASVAALVAAWDPVRSQQIDAIARQLEQLDQVPAEDVLNAVTSITVPATGASVIEQQLVEHAQGAVTRALEEAAGQGVTVPQPDMTVLEATLGARAQATAQVLADSLVEAAHRRALAAAGPATSGGDGPGLTATALADDVRTHLDGLTDAWLTDQFTGAVASAENGGRQAVGQAAEDNGIPVYFEISALLDVNTCPACLLDDGKRYDSLAALRVQMPVAGNKDCYGGVRCRCAPVAVFGEAPASVQ